MDDLDLIRRVTANFVLWQGLRWAPWSLVVLAGPVSAWAPGAKRLEPLPTTVLILAAGLLSWWAGRYYDRVYGRVRERRAHPALAALRCVAAAPVLVAAMLVDSTWQPPVLVTGVTAAALVVAYRRFTGGGRPHWLVVAGALAATSALPLTGLSSREALVAWGCVFGLGFAVGFLLDHVQLARLMPPAGRLTSR